MWSGAEYDGADVVMCLCVVLAAAVRNLETLVLTNNKITDVKVG
jgi:hypothetical protein